MIDMISFCLISHVSKSLLASIVIFVGGQTIEFPLSTNQVTRFSFLDNSGLWRVRGKKCLCVHYVEDIYLT